MFDKFLSDEEIALLEKPFTKEEIVHNLKQMKGRKSPGLDGLHACFLQKYWTVLSQK